MKTFLFFFFVFFSLNSYAESSKQELRTNIDNLINRYARISASRTDTADTIRLDNVKQLDDKCFMKFDETYKRVYLSDMNDKIYDEKNTIEFSFEDIDPKRIKYEKNNSFYKTPYWFVTLHIAGDYKSIYSREIYNMYSSGDWQSNSYSFKFNNPRHAAKFAKNVKALVNLCTSE